MAPRLQSSQVSSDQLLDRFLAYVAQTGLQLYPAQEEAVLELISGKHVILSTPTGSGKSLVAAALMFKALVEGKRAFYTCPIKALVNEKFFWLCELFGPDKVGMATGDAAINREAPLVCATAEILSNLCLREPAAAPEAVVMDEFHYYADRERGVAWQIPLLALEQTQFLLMSATLGEMGAIRASLEQLTSREVAEVRSAQRPVPLEFEYRETPLHETLQDLVARGRHPIYLVNFTQRSAAEQAQNLMSVDFSSKEEKETLRQALFEFAFDTPYGKEMQRFLRHGIGLHHAGLLPKYRLLVERLSQRALLKVISGTDTLGVGVNIPIRTVLFSQLCKFDGEKTAILPAREFHQIAGRAGRKGFDESGTVAVQAPEHVIENLKLAQKAAQGKKVVKKQPPAKGFVPWDRATFDRLVSRPPEPLESRFEVTHGMILNLLQGDPHDGYARLVKLIGRSHHSPYVQRQLLKRSAQATRALRSANLIHLVRGTPHVLPRLEVDPGLQRDFSLHHTLALYLLDTLPQLDPALPTYALDVLTLVESILENPDAVLYRQLDELKGKKVEELKAQGVPYEDRLAELEKLEWPKPNRDFIYGTFNLFAAKHPWVGQEDIRPKSVARDLFERCASFNDYVREYGIQRSEGVLLRYLSEAYKTLVQTVPESYRSEAVEDVIAYLRSAVREVDSSLVDEWEAMQAGRAATPAPASQGPVRAPGAILRNAIHRLLRMLANADYEGASHLLTPGDWNPESLREALAPFLAEHQRIDLTPRAREGRNTLLEPQGPGRWKVRQKILAPDGTDDWMLEALVELPAGEKAQGPLITLLRIGM